MKLLLLWAPLADYSVACMRELALKYQVEMHLVFQPVEGAAPYSGFDLSFCKTATVFSEDNSEKIASDCIALDPDCIIMSSWNYRTYMSISKECRKKNTYVISAFDGQWNGTYKQRLGVLSSPFFLKPSIDNFFVPGDRQAAFARKLGYPNPLIGYYSANTSLFRKPKLPADPEKRFIFVGRLTQVKGIDILMKAYKRYREMSEEPWMLDVYGRGDLQHLVDGREGVRVNGFLQPGDLSKAFENAGCFILPSYHEPWGLVIHEAAVCGLPMIVSHKCGASTYFLRDGVNGYLINPDEESLLNAMHRISSLSGEVLKEMGHASELLGSMWTTEKWAGYIYQRINEVKAARV